MSDSTTSMQDHQSWPELLAERLQIYGRPKDDAGRRMQRELFIGGLEVTFDRLKILDELPSDEQVIGWLQGTSIPSASVHEVIIQTLFSQQRSADLTLKRIAMVTAYDAWSKEHPDRIEKQELTLKDKEKPLGEAAAEEYVSRLPDGARQLALGQSQWLNNKTVALAAVKQAGSNLQYFPAFQDDDEVVMEAVSNPTQYNADQPINYAIAYASERLRIDIPTAMISIGANPQSLAVMHPKMKKIPLVALTALAADPSVLPHVEMAQVGWRSILSAYKRSQGIGEPNHDPGTEETRRWAAHHSGKEGGHLSPAPGSAGRWV